MKRPARLLLDHQTHPRQLARLVATIVIGAAVVISATVVGPMGAIAAPAKRTAVVIHLPEQLDAPRAKVFERALGQALRRLGRRDFYRPDESFARLAREPTVAAERRRATELLGEALVAARQVRFDHAVTLLDAAEGAARRGLARLVDPKLLADVLFQRGVAQLPMKPAESQAALVQSYTIWPLRPTSAPERSPKVVDALQRAAREASSATAPWPSGSECQRAAKVLDVDTLLLATPSSAGRVESVSLLRYDARERRFSKPARTSWAADHGDARVLASKLTAPLTALIGHPATRTSSGGDPGDGEGRGRRRLWPWIATGAAVGLAVASATLFVASSKRLDEAEGMVTTPPSVEYAPGVREIEDSARNLRTGALVTLIGAGIATAAAALLWLSGDEAADPAGARIETRPLAGGAAILLRF